MAENTTVAIKVTADTQSANTSVKSFKTQLREATSELVAMSEKFGVTSVEAANAAKKVAGLKDAIGDAKSLAETFNPDKKFVALGGALQGAVGGFSALQGAMGLFGSEGKEVEKIMLKVQSVMALQQGISGVMGAVDSFQLLGSTIKTQVVSAFSSLKGAIISTGIGALVVALGLLIANWDKVSDAITGATDESKAFAEAQDEINKQLSTAQENLITVKTAFDNAKTGVINKSEALKIYNEKLGDALGKTNDLSVAEKRIKDNEKNYLDSIIARAAAQVLLAKAAEASAKAASGEDTDLSFWDKFLAVTTAVSNQSIAVGLSTATSLRTENKKTNQEIIDNNTKAYTNLITQAQQLEGKIGAEKINANYKTVEQIAADEKAAREKKKEAEEKARLAEREAAKNFLQEQLKSGQEQSDIQYANRLGDDKRADQERADKLAKENQYWSDFGDAELAASERSKAISLQLAQDKKDHLNMVLAATDQVAGLIDAIAGRQTATSKALGIATATINMFQGASEVIRAKSTIPEPFGTIQKIGSVAAILALGIKQVRGIVGVKVPGGGGGGGSMPSAPSLPTAPLTPQAQSTRLDQGSINAIGQASARSYVLESDITSHQERIQRLNRAARIN